MANLFCCCCKGATTKVHRVTGDGERFISSYSLKREETPEDEKKLLDLVQPSTAETNIDQGILNFVKKKVKDTLPPNASNRQIRELATRYSSAKKMAYYFAHLVNGASNDAVLETAEELETTLNNAWERAMQQKRTLQRMQTVTSFPVKLVLRDIQNLPSFLSPFAKMIQLQFGPLHAALVIDNVVVEWDDTGLILPRPADEDWIFQTRLQGTYDKFTATMKAGIKTSIDSMDIQKQIEQVYEVTQHKQEAINQLIQVIIQYNTQHEYNVLTRNCQHFVLDAMKALGINQVPQFTGVFQKYFQELKSGKSSRVLEKFESHDQLDEHVNSIMKPGLTQHDLEYLLCQYFMFHVDSCRGKCPEQWKCPEESCRMSEVESLLERGYGSLLFTTFSLNNS